MKFLSANQFLVVDRSLASALGLTPAIVLQQLHIELEKLKANQTCENFHAGHYWVTNTLKAWHENYFYYIGIDTLKRTFAKLKKAGILLTENFNEDKRNATKWYSIDYEKLTQAIQNSYENQQKGGAL